jgi:hypothetical protein
VSDTPRTDANELVARDTPALGLVVFVDEDERVVDAKFARELERELAAMREQRDEARRLYCVEMSRQSFDPKRFTPEWGANELGWDCYAQKEGGGA